MRLVNRAAITVKPRQPYIDWANRLDHDAPKITLEHLPEQTVYLVEDLADYLVEPQAVVRRYFREIFGHELRAWHRVESDWPQKRTFAVFKEWFEFEVHSMVLDMHGGGIETEEYLE